MKLMKQKPLLQIDPLVKEKMNKLVELSNKEIAWHGLVKRNGMTFNWYDIIVYPQYVSNASVEPDDEEYTKWIMKQDNFKEIRLHGHSHVNMSCSPSGTDIEYRENVVKQLKDKDFYIFIIINKKGSYTIEIYDKLNNIVFDENDINILKIDPEINKKALEWSEKEIKENIKEVKPCLTTQKVQNSLTQAELRQLFMSSDAELLEPQYQSYLQELGYRD